MEIRAHSSNFSDYLLAVKCMEIQISFVSMLVEFRHFQYLRAVFFCVCRVAFV